MDRCMGVLLYGFVPWGRPCKWASRHLHNSSLPPASAPLRSILFDSDANSWRFVRTEFVVAYERVESRRRLMLLFVQDQGIAEAAQSEIRAIAIGHGDLHIEK